MRRWAVVRLRSRRVVGAGWAWCASVTGAAGYTVCVGGLGRQRPHAEPCLPSPPSGRNWIHEIKHEGFRPMARDPAGVRLLTARQQLDAALSFDLRGGELAQGAILPDSWQGRVLRRERRSHPPEAASAPRRPVRVPFCFGPAGGLDSKALRREILAAAAILTARGWPGGSGPGAIHRDQCRGGNPRSSTQRLALR
jgi:hypothetical protein